MGQAAAGLAQERPEGLGPRSVQGESHRRAGSRIRTGQRLFRGGGELNLIALGLDGLFEDRLSPLPSAYHYHLLTQVHDGPQLSRRHTTTAGPSNGLAPVCRHTASPLW